MIPLAAIIATQTASALVAARRAARGDTLVTRAIAEPKPRRVTWASAFAPLALPVVYACALVALIAGAVALIEHAL